MKHVSRIIRIPNEIPLPQVYVACLIVLIMTVLISCWAKVRPSQSN